MAGAVGEVSHSTTPITLVLTGPIQLFGKKLKRSHGGVTYGSDGGLHADGEGGCEGLRAWRAGEPSSTLAPLPAIRLCPL